ncbi:MAG: ferrous iron transport protein B [Actinomycetota bacterium]|nr:ferrous iron transport protein B [Actinomycetota bacterium]
MTRSTEGPVAAPRQVVELFSGARPECVIALVGNPNVGKSTLFNHVTGSEVLTAHYPGKSPDVNVAETRLDGRSVTIVDIPGTYGLSGPAEEQWVSRRTLLDVRPDAVIVVLDATNISRNLALCLEVMDLGLPTILGVNLTDEAARAGIEVDIELLSVLLEVPVISTVAVDGVGVAELMLAAFELTGRGTLDPRHVYAESFEHALRPLVDTVRGAHATAFGLPPRALALQLLEAQDDVRDSLSASGGLGLLRVAQEARTGIAALTGEPAVTALARERHGAAGVMADRCVHVAEQHKPRLEDRLRTLATRASTGVPLLIALLLALFGTLFFVGDLLARGVSATWAALFSPTIQALVHAVFGTDALGRTVLWGVDAGLEASLAIGIPYILTFYFLLALLEDSGYLGAVAFLSDQVMHRFGLHGRAVIPLVAGAGCSVPAVLAVRVLPTQRERFLAATLVSMVPCSARTAVVLGAVGAYVGWAPALGVFVVSGLVTAGVGVAMNRLLPGRTQGMVMEMFPFRRPRAAIVARKAWSQFREFLFVATPLVVVGSMVLGGLYEAGWLSVLSAPMEPVVVGLLGLPAFAGLTLLFGLLRKEFALQLLLTLAIATTGAHATSGLADLMTPTAIFVYALVNTLAMPCVSTMAVLGRTLGWKKAFVVMGITVSTALVVGAFFARVLPLFGW